MKICFLSLLVTITTSAFAQDSTSTLYNGKHFVKDYPKGRYNTLEDFISKKVSPLGNIYRGEFKTLDSIPDGLQDDHIYFVLPKKKKMKKVLAVSYHGELYFNEESMILSVDSADKSQMSSYPKSFHRVLNDGNFLYFECATEDANLRLVGAMVGGVVLATMSNAITKPIIFDFEKNNFNIIKKNKDLNNFLSSKKSPYLLSKNEFIHYNLERIKSILKKEIVR